MKPKLLVVELWGVGDLVIGTPFLRAACQKFSVTLLAKPHAVDLQKRFWPEVEVMPFVAPWTAFRYWDKYRLYAWPWRDLFRLRKILSQRQFDVGLSARWDPRDHFLLRSIGAKQRIGFPRVGSGISLTQSLALPGRREHRYESWRVAGRAVGIDLPPRDEAVEHVAGRRELVLVHSGARLPARVWPLDNYCTVVRRLRGDGHTVQVACDPDQQAWWQQSGETGVACPRTITELLSLVDRAGVFIGNCSGPGHLAAISGVPTFTIFGPSLPEWFAPIHPAAEWIEGQPCPYRPCSDYCRFSEPRCLTELPGETVWPRIRDFVARQLGGLAPTARSVPAAVRSEVATEPLRVLHVHNGADIYGSGRSLLRLLKTIERRRFQPLVVLPAEGPLKELLEAAGVEVVLHPRLSMITRPVFRSWRIALFLANYPISVLWLWRLIRQRRIQLVHTNSGVLPSPALAARLAGVPHVWHVRDWFQEFRKFWPLYAAYIKRFSRTVIAVSNAVADQFAPRGNVIVIHNGFSVDEFDVPKNLRADFRSRYQLEDDFVVGCVGRIKLVRKGQEVLVRAVAILKQRRRPIKALIVGAPFPGNEAHLTQLQILMRQLGVEENVVFTGELSDPRAAYAAMDVLAMTSVQAEPFGGVVMEAMCMGLPVVATRIGGSLDQVAEGVTGIFVPPGDEVALADALDRLKQDPELRNRMGAAALNRIRKDFSLTRMAGRIERLFEESISERQP